jgi:DNA-binding MurR/RpiR family transcriptional regulator
VIMNRAQTLEEIVKAHYANLTPSQKRLSDFILQNSYEAALLSSARLAERLSISEATVVRFAQTLGFDGYISLREKLQDQLLHEVRSSERVATMVSEPAENAGTLYEIVAQTVHFLNQLLDNVSEQDLQEAVDRLNSARQVIIYGEGAPGSLIHHADFWFSRLGLQVKKTAQTGRRFYDHIFLAQKEDVALVLAFRTPYIGGGCTSGSDGRVRWAVHSCNRSLGLQDAQTSHPSADRSRGPMDAFRPLGSGYCID